MNDAVRRRIGIIERVDEYLETHKMTESLRLLNEVRDELVRLSSGVAAAWDEGYKASEQEFQQVYDLFTPDEERFVAVNPYRA